jgi:hypothetical protein
MPVFAALISAFFTGLAGFLAKLFLAKVAMRIAAITAIAALGTGLVLLFNTLVAPLVASLFSTSYGQLLGLAFPPVAGSCIAAFVVLWGACLTYKLQVQAIRVTANI